MPQGKHKKTVLEVPAGVLVKPEGSLGEACALSLPLCLRLTLSHTCTQALCSQSPMGAPCPSWSPGLEEEYPHAHPKSDDTGAPRHPMGPRAPGSEGNDGWEPSRQAGGAVEDARPETLGNRLLGKEGRHLEPS